MYTCRFCNSIYTRKDNLNRHLSICKKYLTMSPIEINNIIEELHTKVIINGNNNNINSNNTTIYININPVSKINIDHISTDKMKYIIENYKTLLISNWIFWIPINFINFRYVPLYYRTVYGNAFGLLWSIYLTHKIE